MIYIRYKKLKSGNHSIYLDIYFKKSDGSTDRKYEFLNIYVKDDYNKVKRIKPEDKEKIELAKVIKSKRELEIYGSQYGLKVKKTNQSVDMFLVLDELLKVKHDDNVISALKHLKKFIGKEKLPVVDLNRHKIEAFKDYLSDMIQHNTMVTYLKRLRAYLNKAVDKGLISDNPMKEFRIPRFFDVERDALTIEDVNLLQKTETDFDPMIRHAFLFACFTGLRYSDIKSLKWTDIKNEQIVLKPEKTSNTTGKILYIPLSSQATQILNIMKEDYFDEYCFPELPSNSTTNKKLKEWAKAAKLNKHLHFHLSRHTFGTIGITAGIDLYAMQNLLGHKTLGMTKQYAKMVNEKLKVEIDKFPTLE